MAYISVRTPTDPVLEFLDEWAMESLEEVQADMIPLSTKVFVNGCWLGVHRNPDELVSMLRHLRRTADVPFVSIVRDTRLQELRLYTDVGRTMRPLFIVQDQQLVMNRDHLEHVR